MYLYTYQHHSSLLANCVHCGNMTNENMFHLQRKHSSFTLLCSCLFYSMTKLPIIPMNTKKNPRRNYYSKIYDTVGTGYASYTISEYMMSLYNEYFVQYAHFHRNENVSIIVYCVSP